MAHKGSMEHESSEHEETQCRQQQQQRHSTKTSEAVKCRTGVNGSTERAMEQESAKSRQAAAAGRNDLPGCNARFDTNDKRDTRLARLALETIAKGAMTDARRATNGHARGEERRERQAGGYACDGKSARTTTSHASKSERGQQETPHQGGRCRADDAKVVDTSVSCRAPGGHDARMRLRKAQQ